MARNHYEVLGVPKGASQAEIRSAYRKLVLQHHPDRNAGAESLETFHRITQAYEVLGDWERRVQYDKLLLVESSQAVVQQRAARKAKSAEPKTRAYAATGKAARSTVVSAEVTRLTLLHSRGQSSMAERLAQKIISHDNRQPIPYAVLGDINRAKGDLKAAAKMYAMAVQMDPGNELYHQRHEEMISVAVVKVGRRDENKAKQKFALGVGALVVLLASIYLILSQEQALLPDLAPISTWTLGVWVMTFLSGVSLGSCLCLAGKLDRFFSVATTALGRVSPVVALGTIAVVNFWVAAFIYVLFGVTQNGFNYSTTRVVSGVAASTLVLSAAAYLSNGIDPAQVLLWGGNLVYMGGLCGWMVADSMRE